MDLVLYFGMSLLLTMCSTSKCEQIPEGVLHMECRERYFMIAVDLSFTGNEPHFEAVDETGVFPITKQYAAKCGYTVSVLPLPDHVELRASYFSCHTDNEDDEVFTFNFNLIATHEGKEVTYALNHTCSPALPWAPREVTCESNYMEVYQRSDVSCPSGTKEDDWEALKHAYALATSDWQMILHRGEQQMTRMNMSEAQEQGYIFDLSNGRLVFRAAYGPDLYSTEVNGVPVEVIQATLFSRMSWVVVTVDLTAACSTYEGSYDDSGYMVWETPVVLDPLTPGPHDVQVNVGANGELVEQSVAEERGYSVEQSNETVQISIPYNAEGGYRKSIVSVDLFEFYIFDLYLEQILMDEGEADSRLRFHRTLATPLLPRPLFTENQTVPEEQTFTVYLGDVPEDVQLTAVHLNGQEFTLPLMNTSSSTIATVVHPNNTHGYTLKVPFNDPVVQRQIFKEDSVIHQWLNINYTLMVLPDNEPYFHQASVMALTEISPPAFNAACSESGIRFSLDHRPYDYLWELNIGSDPLTSELAARNGYVMSNDTERLLLEVPLFTQGYEYTDITLKGFSGTFEILVLDRETSEVQSSTVKTCLFEMSEFIMCSTDGKMTAVADLTPAMSGGGVPARTHLVDKYCGPKEADDTRVFFSIPLNSCGSKVKLFKEFVTYENEIFFSPTLRSVKNPADSSNDVERVILQCQYPLAGLSRLFSAYKFESDTVGVGRVIHSSSTDDLQSPTVAPQTMPASKNNRGPISRRPGYQQTARQIKMANFLKKFSKKGTRGSSQTKVTPDI